MRGGPGDLLDFHMDVRVKLLECWNELGENFAFAAHRPEAEGFLVARGGRRAGEHDDGKQEACTEAPERLACHMLAKVLSLHAYSTLEVFMRLSCRKCLPFVFALPLACHDGTAPPPSILGFYVLESINSQPLPAIIQSGGGDTTTVFWSNLNLDGAGNAVLLEHIRHAHLNSATEATYTTGYLYRVIGDSIAFDYSPPCPPNALCVGPPVGKLANSTLTLSYGGSPPFRLPSFYRRISGVD